MAEKAVTPFFSVLIVVGIMLILSSSYDRERGKGSGDLSPDLQRRGIMDRPLLLVIIDFNSFLCLSCLDSFLDFYDQLSGIVDERMLWGILVFDASLEQQHGSSYIKIVEKKLKGFVKANHIQFPMVIDRFHLFESLGKEGSAVFVFDPGARAVKRYVFPLRRNHIQEIMSLLEN